MKKMTWKLSTTILTLVACAMLLIGIGTLLHFGIEHIAKVSLMNLSFDLMGMLIVFFLLLSCLMDEEPASSPISYFPVLLLIEGGTLLLDEVAWILNGLPEYRILSYVLNTIFYCTGLTLALSYWFFLSRNEGMVEAVGEHAIHITNVVFHVFAVLDIVITLVNIPFGFFFFIDENGMYQRGKFFPCSMIIPFALMLVAGIFIWCSNDTRRHKISLCTYIIFPAVAAVLQNFTFGMSLIYIAILVSIILVYTTVYVQRGRDLARREEQIAKQNMQLMIAQIQPHFIYNTLGTIRGLCKLNPDLAGKTTENFAKYLRTHLDLSLSSDKTMIPVMQEIENCKVYSDIEMVRFPGIKVEYSILDENFNVPIFSIQPLVENAIKHGIRDMKEGRVWVKTYMVEDRHVVEIKDNGVGIEIAKQVTDTTKSHIGMKNVKGRVENTAGGSFKVESEPHKGTTIRMIFP